MGTALNRTVAISLTNKSGQTVTRGDVVVLDSQNSESFTVTGSAALATDLIGVVLDNIEISDGENCLVAISGYVPQVNLVTGAALGDTFGLSSTVKKAIPHSTIQSGDFGQVLKAAQTPPAYLFGFPNNGGNPDFQETYFTGTAAIDLETSEDADFEDVSNSTITFTPTSPGKYLIEYQFSHWISASSNLNVLFRISDGINFSHHFQRHISTGSDVTPININHVFTWEDTTQKTIKLQKQNFIASSVIQNKIQTPVVPLLMRVKRVGNL